MFEVNPIITKEIYKDEAYYTLIWSPLKKADRHQISRAVPLVSGIYELYWMDDGNHLNLLSSTHAWYGGLRSNIREAIDPIAKTDPKLRKILEDKEDSLYYRYSCCDSFKDILDVVWFLHSTYFPDDIRVQHSQRYENFFLDEQTPDKVFWFEK